MQFTTASRKLGRNDSRLIGRDSFAVMMIVYIMIIAVVLRFGVPWVAGLLLAELQFDLAPYYPLLTSYFALVIGPMMAGIVFGFLLLEERDAETLKAMLVTPMPLNTFILYRIVIATLLAFVFVLATLLIVNLTAFTALELILVSLCAALFGPIIMMFFATFAANKVEGFALTKIASLVGIITIVAWFIPEPWQYLVGFFPPFWVSKTMWIIAGGGGAWLLHLAVCLVLMLVVLWWFVRRFRTVAYR
jgi:fluoroquinolone transport system permease protein